MGELPGNRHGLLTDVAPVGSWAKKPKRPVIRSEPRKQQYRASFPHMVAVAQSGRAVRARQGLTFPMDQRRADRVVAISRRWGEGTAALVESKSKKFRVLCLCFIHAALP